MYSFIEENINVNFTFSVCSKRGAFRYVTIIAINVFYSHTPWVFVCDRDRPTLSLFSVYNTYLNPAVSQKTAACENRLR